MLATTQPVPQFFDLDGSPLDSGSIYYGAAGQNPETAPITVYWDSAGTQPATQPVRTMNGYPVRGGSPAVVYAGTNYSVTVRDRNGRLVMTAASSLMFDVSQVTQALVDDLRADLAATGAGEGAESIGLLQTGTGAQPRTIDDKERDVVSVFDFMTTAQIADVRANTAATNLSAALDVTAEIQAAITEAATRSSVGAVVHLPAGSYKITGTINANGSGGAGQVAIRGSGQFSTRIFPAADITAVKLSSAYVDSGWFSVEWPVTAAASISASRIGVEFAGPNNASSYAKFLGITVMYAYRGFVLNDWTAQPSGTMFLTRLERLSAFRCADWGIYLNSKTGSTTLVAEHLYARGDSSSGGQYGKGIFINNFNDVTLISPAVDQCLDNWLHLVNLNQACVISLALESCKCTSTSAVNITANGSAVGFNSIKFLGTTLDTGGAAKLINIGANCRALTLKGFSEQATTVVAGTTEYKVSWNVATSHFYALDNTVLPTEVFTGGFFAGGTFEGRRMSLSGMAPNYGTWTQGSFVWNNAPSELGSASSKYVILGWSCVTAGTPGTWLQSRALTGN